MWFALFAPAQNTLGDFMQRGAIIFASIISLGASSALSQEIDGAKTEEIIISATRTKTKYAKTPIAASLIGSKELEQSAVSNPTNLPSLVPALNIDRTIGLQLTLRGVTSTDNTEKGDPSVGFLLDGIYIARPHAQEVSFHDLARIEVLKGPQGTLYGRNSTGGLINIISNGARLENSNHFEISAGNYGALNSSFVFNRKFDDKNAIRTAINFEQRDNFVKNLVSDDTKQDPFKQNLSFRVSTLHNLSDDSGLEFVFDYAQIKGHNGFNVRASNFYNLPFGNGKDPEYIGGSFKKLTQLTYDNPNNAERNNHTGGLKIGFNHKISDKLNFEYLGSLRLLRLREDMNTYIGSNSAGSQIIPSKLQSDYYQDSHELRFAYDGEKLDAQIGYFDFYEKSKVGFYLYGLIQQFPNRGYVFGFPQNPMIANSRAIFAQASYEFLPKARLTIGLRNTWDDKYRMGHTIFHQTDGQPIDYTFGDFATNPFFLRDSLNLASMKYEKLTGKIGLDYELAPETFIYGNYSTGYKAGGFNDGCETGPNCANPIPAAALYYRPETIKASEIGIKGRAFYNHLSYSIDAFHYDYEDLQLSQYANLCGGPCQITTNAAKAKIDGIDIDAKLKIDNSNSFIFSAALLDARFDDYQIRPDINLKGKKLDRSPNYTINLGYSHKFAMPSGWNGEFNLRERFVGEYFFLSTPAIMQFRQPRFNKTDLSVSFSKGAKKIILFANNLENYISLSNVAIAVDYPNLNDGSASFHDPRTFGAKLVLDF